MCTPLTYVTEHSSPVCLEFLLYPVHTVPLAEPGHSLIPDEDVKAERSCWPDNSQRQHWNPSHLTLRNRPYVFCGGMNDIVGENNIHAGPCVMRFSERSTRPRDSMPSFPEEASSK